MWCLADCLFCSGPVMLFFSWHRSCVSVFQEQKTQNDSHWPEKHHIEYFILNSIYSSINLQLSCWHISSCHKQRVMCNQCCEYCNFVDVCCYRQHVCTSVRPGRGIPHMWLSQRFLCFFPYSSWGIRAEDDSPCWALWDKLWIWVIPIQFDWYATTQCVLEPLISKFGKYPLLPT